MAPHSLLLIWAFFASGLAFFALGLATALEGRRSSALVLARGLTFLVLFGFLQSVVEWIDMGLLLQAQAPDGGGVAILRIVKIVLLASSTMSLSIFGVRLLATVSPSFYWVSLVLAALGLVWLLASFLPNLRWAEGPRILVSEATLCLQCHWGGTEEYLTLEREWVADADILARYLLYFPSSILAAVAIAWQRRLYRYPWPSRIRRDFVGAALAFAFNAVVAGLVVPPAPYWPASILNYASFYDWLGVPPQIFRSVAAFGISVFIVRVLSIFEIEYRRRLDRAQEERFKAQQETLETQERAQEQLSRWNIELEQRVVERTQEVAQRNRQLAILGERERIAREMHDSLAQSLSYIGLKLLTLKQLLRGNESDRAIATVTHLEDVLQAASADVRESILGLKIGVNVERKGFLPTLSEYISNFEDYTGISTGFRVQGDQRLNLDPIAEVQTLRILQEALTNVRKHSKATDVWVEATIGDSTITIKVKDNGVGFDLESITKTEGRRFGLQIMNERAKETGGRLEIRTAPGKGTEVILEVPLAQHDEDSHASQGGNHGQHNSLAGG